MLIHIFEKQYKFESYFFFKQESVKYKYVGFQAVISFLSYSAFQKSNKHFIPTWVEYSHCFINISILVLYILSINKDNKMIRHRSFGIFLIESWLYFEWYY